MAKKYDNEFKIMIVELLQSGIKATQISQEYGLNISMIGRWRREYGTRSGGFSKKRELRLIVKLVLIGTKD